VQFAGRWDRVALLWEASSSCRHDRWSLEHICWVPCDFSPFEIHPTAGIEISRWTLTLMHIDNLPSCAECWRLCCNTSRTILQIKSKVGFNLSVCWLYRLTKNYPLQKNLTMDVIWWVTHHWILRWGIICHTKSFHNFVCSRSRGSQNVPLRFYDRLSDYSSFVLVGDKCYLVTHHLSLSTT